MPEESTTPDLVEIVTGLFEAGDRGDWDTVLRPYAPDAILQTDDGIFVVAGASGLRALWEEWAGMFEDFTVKVESVLDLGNGVVYAVYHQEGRPAGSTRVVTATGTYTYEWVDGMISRVILGGAEIDEARAAAERLAEEREHGG